MLFFCYFILSFCLWVIRSLRENSAIFVNLRRSSGQSMRERSVRWPLFLVFKGVSGCIEGIRGIMGCSGVFRGCFRGVLGCSEGVPGMFRGVPGAFRDVPWCAGGVPGFTDTVQRFQIRERGLLKSARRLEPRWTISANGFGPWGSSSGREGGRQIH